jgi:mono/diheme cytochrome c family protein
MIRPLTIALALVPILASALPPRLAKQGAGPIAQLASDRDGIDFFEERVRPLFATRCAGCHMGGMKSQLDLGSRENIARGGAMGPILVPGKPDESRLIRALRHEPGAPAMPPGQPILPELEIATVADWIRRGAPMPGANSANVQVPGSEWWAFQPIRTRSVPNTQHPTPNPVDAFLLSELNRKGVHFSPQADRRTLLRRVTYDLTGLPPTPAETSAFLADRSPKPYEKVVDRLLASPRYGERWGRHWLDVAHYADTHGYDKDKRRDNAWPYRDYVIRAFNEDKPYTRFVREQLAGDALYPNARDGIVATGFLAAGPWDFVGEVELAEGTVEKEKTRLLDRDDYVASTIGAFDSVTIHCARCHDHKFDPIPQADYYSLQAVFAGIERGDRPYAGTSHTESISSSDSSPTNGFHSAISPTQDVTKWVQVDLGKPVPLDSVRLIPARPTDFADTPGFGFPIRYRVDVTDSPVFDHPIMLADRTASDSPNLGDQPVVIPAAGKTARFIRVTATRLWKRTGDFVFALGEVQAMTGGRNVALGAPVSASDSIEQSRWSARFLTDGFSSRSGLTPVVYAVRSRPPRPIRLLSRGDVEQPREGANPGALSCIGSLSPAFALPVDSPESTRRARLADWIVDRGNPLTWRSIVNRVWEYHFGTGIVDTPNDFGRNGGLPSHPALLDWLADIFRRDAGSRPYACGASFKRLHRLIVTSQGYRQSSRFDPDAAKVDGGNRLLWRFSPRRLDAEEIRDTILAVSGTMDLTMGGPGYEPFRFKDDHSPIYDHTDATKIDDPKTWRRTVYRFTVRSVPDPFLDSLDLPDPNVSTPVRSSTLTAPQSLALLNDAFIVRQAERFADRVKHAGSTPAKQIDAAYRFAFQRAPSPGEMQASLTYVARHGLANFCRILYNTNELIFLD